jgi:uncharacterized membrane protein YphA (DoxX/SURF4 family)
MSMRSIATRVASPIIAPIFIRSGLDAAMDPEGKVKKAEKVTGPIAQRVTVLPDDTETLVRLNGVTQVVAGAMLSLGILRRLSAAVLVGTLIPTTLAGHRFWEELDDDVRNKQITHFAKNLGLLGGLLLVATETKTKTTSAPRPSKERASKLRFRRAQ